MSCEHFSERASLRAGISNLTLLLLSLQIYGFSLKTNSNYFIF